jgi:hypothetical protein
MTHSTLLEALAKGPTKHRPEAQREQSQTWLDSYRVRSHDPDEAQPLEAAHFTSVGV